MPSECCVGGCSNSTVTGSSWEESCSLHRFPNSAKQRARHQAWVNFVRTTRADFTPSTTSVVCSKHFTDESFRNKMEFVLKLGMNMTCLLLLNNDAVPTIKKLAPSKTDSDTPSAREARSVRRDIQKLLLNEDSEDDSEDSDSDSLLSDMSVHDVEESDDDAGGVDSDSDWEPELRGSSLIDGVTVEQLKKDMHVGDPVREKKFLVEAGTLLDLLCVCPNCRVTGEKNLVRFSPSGAVGIFLLQCLNCRQRWHYRTAREPSQLTNSQLTAAVLFTGNQFSKISRYMETTNVAFPGADTYYRNQRLIHHRVVRYQWNRSCEQAVSESKEQDVLSVAGDARCDSKGFSAQFGTYTLMNLESSKIIDLNTISRVETNMNSGAMELEGLKRGLAKLNELQLQIENLVTDRHVSISKWMREKRGDIHHYYDCWHVAKSVSSKLKKIAARAACKDELTPDIQRSVINRLYGMASSTPVNEHYGEVMDEKRAAIVRHLSGQCRHPDHTHYKECHHDPPMSVIRLRPGGAALEDLTACLQKPDMRRAISRLSPVGQTSRLEAFHSSILQYAPKHTAFSYTTMVSRIQLAAIHHNYNCSRQVVMEDDGVPKVRVVYLKWKGGAGSSKLVRVQPSYSYLASMMQLNYDAAKSSTIQESLPELVVEPPSMASQLTKESAEVASQRRKSRFRTE